MTTMIERVASALYLAMYPGHKIEDATPYVMDTMRLHARAAIGAMREPTDLMGLGLRQMQRQPYKPGSHSATEIWRSMIDGAIAEGEGA